MAKVLKVFGEIKQTLPGLTLCKSCRTSRVAIACAGFRIAGWCTAALLLYCHVDPFQNPGLGKLVHLLEMTTLAESFLADLDDLSDASDHDQAEEQHDDEADQVRRLTGGLLELICTRTNSILTQMLVDDIEALNYDSLEAVAHLRASDRYKDIMQVGDTSLVPASTCHKCSAFQHKRYT